MHFFSFLFSLALLPQAHASLDVGPLARLIRSRTCAKELVQVPKGKVLVVVALGEAGSVLIEKMASDLHSYKQHLREGQISYFVPPRETSAEKLVFIRPIGERNQLGRFVGALEREARLRKSQVVLLVDDPYLEPNKVELNIGPLNDDDYTRIRVGVAAGDQRRRVNGLVLLVAKMQQLLHLPESKLPQWQERVQLILEELNSETAFLR